MTANGRRGSARSLLALGAWITWSFRRGTGDRDALAGLELAHAVGVDAVAGPAGEAGPAVPAAILDLVDGLGGLHAAGEPGQVLRGVGGEQRDGGRRADDAVGLLGAAEAGVGLAGEDRRHPEGAAPLHDVGGGLPAT
jgi:hypothetical protein